MACPIPGRDGWPLPARLVGCLALALALVLTLALGWQASCALASGQDKDKQDEVLIRYQLDDELQTVGFVVLDGQGGSKKLTPSEEGDSNTTVVRIDGKDVEFGGDAGTFGKKAEPLGKDAKGKERLGVKTVWTYEKIKITQIVEIVRSKTKRLDTCVVSYEMENLDTKDHDVGIRAMVDIMIDNNDGAAFTLPAKQEIISKSADFAKAKDVPAYVEVLENEDLTNPGLVAKMSFKVGGKLEAPGRVSLTHWPGGAGKELDWDIPVEDLAGDSAVVMYWNPTTLRAGGQRSVGYGYGLGVVEMTEAKGK
jgi:hypothetical protein